MEQFTYSYPTHVAWNIDLQGKTDPLEIFRPKTAKKLRKAEEIFRKSEYKFVVEDVDQAYLQKFLPLYNENIDKKHNPRRIDVEKIIIQKAEEGKVYKSVSLYNQDVFHGGLIFSVFPDKVSAAYKVFPKILEGLKLPLSPTYLAELEFYTFALENKKSKIVHGADRNTYGENSAIGLALFKLQIGNTPFVSKKKDNEILRDFQWNGEKDTLIFHGDSPEEQITKATLYIAEPDEDYSQKYAPLLNSKILECEVVIPKSE